MRRGWHVSLAWLLWLAGMAEGKSNDLTTPPLRVDKGVFVGPCDAAPLEQTGQAFPADTGCLMSWLDLRDLTGSHSLRFLYYDPSGSLYATTKEDWKLEAKNKKTYHKTAHVQHRLPIAGEQASILLGTWKVAVVLDTIAVADGSFRIERPQPPESPELAEGRKLYLELQYEKAIERLRALATADKPQAVRAEALWWLSLSLLSLGKRAEAQQSLGELLKIDPTYAVTPEAAHESGAEELSSLLEELRSQSVPELYRKTAAPPEVQLSKAEAAPIVKKRRPLWKKLVYYVGIPVAAVGTVALIATAVVQDRLTNPPLLLLDVDESKAKREPLYGGLCEGAVPMRLSVSGGEPPLELFVTAARVGGNREASVPGVVPELDTVPRVLLKRSTGDGAPLTLPAIDVEGAGAGAARLVLVAVVRDRKTPLKFDGVVVGGTVPSDLQAAIQRRDPLNRLSIQTLFEVFVSDCKQVP
jgi:tetratricopeptide (TPR) repeat protein